MKKVLLGMSGGVDSSVSAILLKNEGYEVIGVTFLLHDDISENLKLVKDSKNVCEKLNIAHLIYDFKEEFKNEVINYFISSYEKGKTPNPCIMCNKNIKFKLLYDKAKELNVGYIATGHYADVKYVEKYDSKVITKSKSNKKDQTYFLYSINKEIIDKCIFPLAKFETKDEIRKIAKDYGLSIASKSDSQDICFIPDGDYVKFLKKNNAKNNVGNFIDLKGNVISKHKGIINYTIGQRKGLGLSMEKPTYVVSFKDNDIIVGEEKDIYTNKVNVSELNFLIDIKYIKDNMKVNAKIRYASKEEEAYLIDIKNNKCIINFINKQRAVTKGQSIVFYDNDILIGGGVID